MNEGQKTILIVGIITLCFIWSFWFFSYFPRDYSGTQIQKRCDEETRKSRYCIGFAEGYEWAWAQMRLDENLKNITPETTEEELKKIKKL